MEFRHLPIRHPARQLPIPSQELNRSLLEDQKRSFLIHPQGHLLKIPACDITTNPCEPLLENVDNRHEGIVLVMVPQRC